MSDAQALDNPGATLQSAAYLSTRDAASAPYVSKGDAPEAAVPVGRQNLIGAALS